MVFTAPAVQYSALATRPPQLRLSKSQQYIQHTTNTRSKFNRIFRKLLFNGPQGESIHLSENTSCISRTIDNENINNTSLINENPNNNNSEHLEGVTQDLTRSMSSLNESSERLPFTEPYLLIPTKDEKLPHLQLSTFQKHCIHQKKNIDDEQCGTQNFIDRPHQLKFDQKLPMSTPISSASTSIEDCIGLQYACRKTSLTNSHILRSSHIQQQSTHLRRLHSKSKVRSNSNFYKTFSNAPRKKSLTSSIAHRIELLKQAMENNELEDHQQKLVKNSTLKLSSSTSPINIINKQTQTNTSQSQLSEIHYIHHHHIHSSSILSFEWRTYLSVIGTIILLILLFMQFITIHF